MSKIIDPNRTLILSSGPDNFESFASMALGRKVNFGIRRDDHHRMPIAMFRFGAIITCMAIEGGGGHNWNFKAIIALHDRNLPMEGWFCNRRNALDHLFKGQVTVSNDLFNGAMECASWLGVTAN